MVTAAEHPTRGAATDRAASGWLRRSGLRRRIAGLISLRWILLAVLLIGVLIYVPIVDNFRVSTTNRDIFTGEITNVGLANYERLLQDPVVWSALLNNTLYALLSIIFQVFGAFLLAAMIEGLKSKRARNFWRAMYFIPSAISTTVTGLLFYFIYQPDVGLLDAGLRAIGLGDWARPWLALEETAIFGIIAMSQWQGFGYSTLLFSIAIQKIPRELYDAAIMDGAGPIRRLWSITFPMSREMTGLMVIVTITGAFQVFNEIMVMTAGGPNNSSQVLGTWLYQQAFIQNEFGYGAAIAAVIFVVTMLTGAAQVWYTAKRRVKL